MKRTITLATLHKKLPPGFALPTAFDAFVEAAAESDPTRHGWFDIKWTNPANFGLGRGAAKTLTPFLRLGGGGIVAFWIREEKADAPAAIVHLDSEGSSAVAAENFDEFLARLAKRKTGVPDIDEADETFPPSDKTSVGKPRPIPPALRAKFAKWLKENADVHTRQPADAASARDLEKLRRQIHKAAIAMLRDKNISPIYSPRDDWWSLELHGIRQQDGSIHLEYLRYGERLPLPPEHASTATPLFAVLLTHVKHTKRASYQITIIKSGLVSVDKDRELVLEPIRNK